MSIDIQLRFNTNNCVKQVQFNLPIFSMTPCFISPHYEYGPTSMHECVCVDEDIHTLLAHYINPKRKMIKKKRKLFSFCQNMFLFCQHFFLQLIVNIRHVLARYCPGFDVLTNIDCILIVSSSSVGNKNISISFIRMQGNSGTQTQFMFCIRVNWFQ